MARLIGRYEILTEIGRGGFGHVYRGLDPTVGRSVAIKTLASDGDAGMLTRFRNEATASGRLRHPNIVTIYDFGEQDNVPYIVMELLEGQDLQQVISGGAPVSQLNKVRIMTQIAAGLQHAHSHGVIHRDVKPANVMVLPDGSVKIMDFGIALITQATESRLTPRGAMIGTFRYMAPEQFRNAQTDARSDIFAYGLIFYELLSGVHPFHAADAGALMYNILSVDPVPIGELVPDCPKELQAVIGRLLNKDPEARYQNLDDVLFDIEPALGELRRKRAQELLQEAETAKSAQRFDTAKDLVRQILELTPGDDAVRKLREGIQLELRRQAIRPKVDALIKTGREALAAGRPSDAVERFESAIRLADVPEVGPLLEEARAGVQRSREASRLASEAESAHKSGDLAGAAGLARQALELAPDPVAQRILAEAETALYQEKRRTQLAEDLARAQRLIDIRSWDEASALIAKIDREFPGSFEAAVLAEKRRAGLAKEEREKLLASGSAAARQQVQQGDLSGALATLEKLAAQYPESSDVEKMLGFVKVELETKTRRDFIEKNLDEAKAAGGRRQFEQAIQLLDTALARYPGDPDLQRERRSLAAEQREAIRRSDADKATAAANSLRSQGRFPEALPPLDDFLATHGNDTAITNLRDVILKEQEAARRAAELHEFVHRARDLMAEGLAEDATALLKAPPSHLKNHPEVTELLGVAQLQLQEQAERKAALEKVLAATDRLRQKASFEEASRGLDAFQTKYGADAKVDAARSEIRQAQRDKAAKDLLAQGTAMLSRDPAGATALFAAAPAEIRQQPEIQNLERAALRAIEEQKARTAAMESAISAATVQRSQGNFSGALQPLDGFLAKYGANPAIEDLREAILKEQEAARLAGELRGFIQETKALISSGRYDDAASLLRSAPPHVLDQPEIAQLVDSVQLHLRQQAERAKAAQDLLTRATTMLASDPGGVTALLGSAPQDLRQQPEIQSLEQAALRAIREKEQEAARRAAELQRLLQQAKDLLARDRAGDAVALLEASPEYLKDRPEVTQLLDAARVQIQQQAERAAAAKELLARAKAILASDPAGVVALLGVAPDDLRRHPEIQSVQRAASQAIEQERVREAEQQERERVRQETIDKIHAFIAKDQYEDATRALTSLLGKEPADGELLELRAELETRQAAWAAERKERNIREGLGRAKDLVAASPEEALRLLDTLQRDYPDREEIAAAHREALEAVSRKQRRDLIQDVERLCQQDEFDAALARLAATPEDRELIQLRKRVQSDQRQALDRRVAAAVQAATDLRQRDPKRALQGLQALPESLRNRPEIQTAAKECQQAIATAERQAAIASIEDLIARGKFRKARTSHAAALGRFGTDPQFNKLLSEIEVGIQRSPKPVWAKPIPLAAGLGTLAILGTTVWIYAHRPASVVTPLMQVEIRTDPAGAAVRIGDRSCQTPNCNFDLPPGSYSVRTQLNGYQPAERTLTVGSEKRLYSFNVALEPVVVPPPPPGRPTGTLVVQTKPPDAVVFIDNNPVGRTDSQGRLSSLLETATHTVRVEKTGYQTPPEQRVRIAENQSQTRVFTLNPEITKVEKGGPGGPGGPDINGPTGGIATGNGTGNGTKADPAEQEWELARTTSDPGQVQSYIDKYPKSSHLPDAQSRLEALTWQRVDQNSLQSLRDYLNRFRGGAHENDARAKIAELAWNGVNQSDEQALRLFVQQNPDNPHRSQAQTLLAELEKQRIDAENRLKQQRAKDEAKKQLDLQSSQILAALGRFNDAFANGKRDQQKQRELKAVWPDVSKSYLDAVTIPRVKWGLEVTRVDSIAGDSATVLCNLKYESPQGNKSEPMKVTLQKQNGEWIIRSLKAN